MTRQVPNVTIGPRELARALGRPTPTRQQCDVIEGDLEPTLVIAGAGSGKTETIAQRVVYLVANGMAEPGQILGLTFTRKAAGELATRIRTRLAAAAAVGAGDPQALDRAAASQPTIATYHAFAGHVIGEFGPLIGIDPAARILTPTATWQLARRVVRRWDGDLDTDHSPERVTEEILAIASSLADHLVEHDALRAELMRISDSLTDAPPSTRQRAPLHTDLRSTVASLAQRLSVLPLLEAFLAEKRRAHVLDFSDQMRLAARIVREAPQAAATLRLRFPLVFLDEYQDTGHSQRVILRGLFGAAPDAAHDRAPSARGHAVTAVGDPVQSIYSWRGASASNLPRFATDFPCADGSAARRRELLVSFRNDRAVLDVANAVSASVRSDPVAVGTLEPATAAGPGDVAAALLPTSADEDRWVAAQIARRWQHGQTGQAPTTAVLLRRRSGMADIAQALREQGLPVEVVGVGGLIDEPEVADVIAMLRMVVDHESGPAAVRILTGARFRLGIADLAALSRRARALRGDHRAAREEPTASGHYPDARRVLDEALAEATGGEDIDMAGLVDAVVDPGDKHDYSRQGWERIAVVRGDLARLRELLASPLTDLVREVERTLDLDIEVLLTADGRAHLDAFADVVHTVAAAGGGPVELLDYLVAAAEREDGLAPGDVGVHSGCVQVLTVHAAKGLEWDLVAVPHLVDGVFPSSNAGVWLTDPGGLPPSLRGDRGDLPALDLPAGVDQRELAGVLKEHRTRWRERQLTEERRLFYVAVTRARHGLLLSAHHWGPTRKEPAGPSEFFTELVTRRQAGSDPDSPEVVAEVYADAPADGETNPLLAQPRTGMWPADPLVSTRRAVRHAAHLVEVARASLGAIDQVSTADGLPDEADDPDGWMRDALLLLAEREASARRRPDAVAVPAVATVSSLVDLASDPAEWAKRIRRPMPSRPAPTARRGTDFHAWVEQYYRGEPLLDLAQLPGAGDRPAADPTLAELIDAFRSSPFATRTPVAVEVPFVTHLAGMAVRGRIDAVFGDADGAAHIIDWKTGDPPGLGRRHAAAVQLVAYRLAWARLTGLPLDRVRASFYYLAHGRLVTPAHLATADELDALIGEAIEQANMPRAGNAEPRRAAGGDHPGLPRHDPTSASK